MGIHPTDNFKAAVVQKTKVALEIDADIAEYLKDQFGEWQGHANDLLRFFMDTSQTKELEFEASGAAFEEPAGATP